MGSGVKKTEQSPPSSSSFFSPVAYYRSRLEAGRSSAPTPSSGPETEVQRPSLPGIKDLVPLMMQRRDHPLSGVFNAIGVRLAQKRSVEEQGVSQVYADASKATKAISKLPPRDQATFLAGTYAQMQLANPRMLFPGYASFVVTNIYSQVDSRFPSFSQNFATKKLLQGTFTVFAEITPALTALATGIRNKWDLTKTIDAIRDREGIKLDPYRHASLDYLMLNKKQLSARMTLMNEQYNTLQPLLYTSMLDRVGYRLAKALGTVEQQVTISANPHGHTEHLSLMPTRIDGQHVDFGSPEQRWQFGSAGIAHYKKMCQTDPHYVVSQLEEQAARAKKLAPDIFGEHVEKYFPSRSTEENVQAMQEAFKKKKAPQVIQLTE